MIDAPAAVVQGLGWLAAVVMVASFQGRDRPTLIRRQMAAYVILSVHFALLGAATGAAMAVIGVARLICALVMDDHPVVRRLYPLFFPVIWLATAATATGWESLLPAIGYTLGTYAVWQRDVLTMRVLFLTAHPLWLAYDLLVGSHGGVAMEIANILSSGAAILRHHWLPHRARR